MKTNKINEVENNGVIRKRLTDKVVGIPYAKSFIGFVIGLTVVLFISAFAVAGESIPDATDGDIASTAETTTMTTNITTSVTSLSQTTYTDTTTETTSVTLSSTSSNSTSLIKTTVKQKTEATTAVEETISEEAVEVDTYEEPVYQEDIPEYIGFKPGTHYVHKSTCRWFDSSCYEITSTDGIEARKCTECNPNIEIVNQYVAPEPVYSSGGALDYITELEYIYLCNTVGHEYGSDWVSIYDKACVVAVVMNRVNDGGWSGGRTNNIKNVITAPGQFNPSYATDYYHSCVTQSCKDAVDYYFANQSSFPHYTSFWGDGRVNHFS